MADEVASEARALAQAVDRRVLASAPPLPPTPEGLYDSIRTALMKASDERVIKNGSYAVSKLLRPTRGALHRQAPILIDGGTEAEPFIRSSDGAAFSFGVTVEYRTGGPRLVSFRYELKYPDVVSPSFLRFDLRGGPHEDPLREPQCHIHPGHRDIRCPFPLMAPAEMIGFLIHGCRIP